MVLGGQAGLRTGELEPDVCDDVLHFILEGRGGEEGRERGREGGGREGERKERKEE